MKKIFKILFLVFSFSAISQTPKPDKIKLISSADTVIFSVNMSGCFNAGITTYKFAKLKSGERNVIYKKANVLTTKKITLKNYDTFIYRFKMSAMKFKYAEEGKYTCTTVTKFELSDKKESANFTNGTCEVEFDPEELLKQLLK